MERIMPQYIVRKGRYGHEIAKFDDSNTSLDTYTIDSRGCSCPARSRSCKHTRILRAWKKNTLEGMVFDDDAQEIGNIFNFNTNTTTSSRRIIS
tara:strand:- start:26 stop:307 length:282 start_codon:yes stop_codon:yes gene_type:complete